MRHGELIITGGGYAKLKERQGSKELLDPGTASVSKMPSDGAEEGLMSECKGDQSSATPGRQSVGLLAGTARLMKRAVATADRYRQFVDADIDTEAAPITSSDYEADGHSDESNDADEPKPSYQSRPDFQYTEFDDVGHHSTRLSLPQVFTPATAATAAVNASTAAQQPVVQIQKFPTGGGHNKRTVRRRPAKPDLSAHTSPANPFSLGKIQPPMSYDVGASECANSAPMCHDKVDVFGAAPFRRKVSGPADRTELADNVSEPDVFANVPFIRQQEKVAKMAASVSPPATSKVGCVPNPALSSDVGGYSTFSSAESHSNSGLYIISSTGFNQTSSGPTSAAFVPTEPVTGDAHANFVSTVSSVIPPYGVEAQEMNVYAQQDSGPLLTALPVSATGECLDQLSCNSKASSHVPVLPPDAGQSVPVHEEPQAAEECHGSLKRGWLAKLRSDKESTTTAVANLGFSDDPDAIFPASTLSSATDLSFREDMLDVTAEPKSPAVTSESNFLLPSGEGSHTLPKVGAKKHLSHQQHVPLMLPETESFSATKKGIALL